MVRLDKYLADASIGTRSEVKAYIKSKRVSVNGNTKVSADTKVNPEEDEVTFDGKAVILSTGFKYYILNKPAGVITATKDDRDKTVLDLFPVNLRKDLSPVGRLDKDTEGMLILTNDGAFNHRLMSPKKHVAKKYFAKLSDICEDTLIDEFKNGLDIGDEKLLKPAILEILDDKTEVYVTISEGRYHQVKRMFSKFGLRVEYLKRISIADLRLPNDLELGQWRELSKEELAKLS